MNLRRSSYPNIKKMYLSFLKKREVVGKPIADKIGKLNKFYLPLSEWIYSNYKKDKKIKIIGLSGGQGAGKGWEEASGGRLGEEGREEQEGRDERGDR